MVPLAETIVTVGLCTKNSEKTILESVRGIAEQDFPHQLMEVIVVDSNSQDQTISILRQILSTSSIKTTFYSENIGLGFARQIVVDQAKGKYIIWVDGDVILSKGYIKQQVAFMETNPTIGLAIGTFGILEDDNWVAALENIGYVIETLKHPGISTTKLIGAGGSICRVEAAKQVGGFNKNIKGAHEDMDIAYKLRRAGWAFYTTNAIFYHRQHATWKALWKQYYWYGYGLHFLLSTHKGSARDKALDRVVLSSLAYKLTHRKVLFLLPLHFAFKKTAELFGLLAAHIDGYGHSPK